MSYQAVVGRIQCAPHPNADRLKLAYIKGHRVVTSIDADESALWVLFPADGQLSKELCDAHDLVLRKDDQGNKLNNAYFDDKRKVRAMNLRQVKSEGFIMPLSDFAFTGYDISKLKEGDMFDTLNKIPICNKYYTKATQAAIQGKKGRIKASVDMPEHNDTAQFRFVDVPEGAHVIITEKEHGTSFRYGNVMAHRPSKLKDRVGAFLRGNGWPSLVSTRGYSLGTRRVVLPKISETEFQGGFYGNGDPYSLAAAKLSGKLKRR